MGGLQRRHCTPRHAMVVDVGANPRLRPAPPRSWSGKSEASPSSRNSENCRLLLSSLRLHGTGTSQSVPVAADTANGWAIILTHVGSNRGGLIDDRESSADPGRAVRPSAATTSSMARWARTGREGAEDVSLKGDVVIERDRPVITTESGVDAAAGLGLAWSTSATSRVSGMRHRSLSAAAARRSPTRRSRLCWPSGRTRTNCASG